MDIRGTSLVCLVCLTTCLPPTPPPDTIQEGTKIWWQGHKPIAGIGAAAAVVYAKGLAICPPKFTTAFKNAWAPEVYFEDAGFDCGDPFPVDGCQPYPLSTRILIAWKPSLSRLAIPDELGHAVWEDCFGTTGEVLRGTTDTYDASFAAFVTDCRQAISEIDAGP